MSKIYHITTKEQWDEEKQKTFYHCASLINEGFIHCSSQEQVIKTANRLFFGKQNLLLLEIEENCILDILKYEKADNDTFPHLYGPLPIKAITTTYPFPCNKKGDFSLPQPLEN